MAALVSQSLKEFWNKSISFPAGRNMSVKAVLSARKASVFKSDSMNVKTVLSCQTDETQTFNEKNKNQNKSGQIWKLHFFIRPEP